MMSGWLVTPTNQGSAVTPLDDLVVHSPYDDHCVCVPRIEAVCECDEPGYGCPIMVTHHSLDGREHAEQQA